MGKEKEKDHKESPTPALRISRVTLNFVGFPSHKSSESPSRRVIAEIPTNAKYTLIDLVLFAKRDQLADDEGVDSDRCCFYTADFAAIPTYASIGVLRDGESIVVAYNGSSDGGGGEKKKDKKKEKEKKKEKSKGSGSEAESGSDESVTIIVKKHHDKHSKHGSSKAKDSDDDGKHKKKKGSDDEKDHKHHGSSKKKGSDDEKDHKHHGSSKKKGSDDEEDDRKEKKGSHSRSGSGKKEEKKKHYDSDGSDAKPKHRTSHHKKIESSEESLLVEKKERRHSSHRDDDDDSRSLSKHKSKAIESDMPWELNYSRGASPKPRKSFSGGGDGLYSLSSPRAKSPSFSRTRNYDF